MTIVSAKRKNINLSSPIRKEVAALIMLLGKMVGLKTILGLKRTSTN